MSDLQKLFPQAIEYHQSGNFDSAIEAYTTILEIAPDHPDALHLKGMACYQKGDADSAEPLIRAAIQIRPDHRDYHSNYGLVLNQLGRTRDAVHSYKNALQIDPSFADAQLNLANAHIKLDETAEAEAALQTLLSQVPTHAEANNSLGTVLSGLERYDEAKDAFQRAIDDRPGYVDAHANLGQLLARIGDDEKALSHIRRATEMQPDDVQMLRIMGSVYHELGAYQEALDAYARALRIEPENPVTYLGIGSVYLAQNRLDDAEKNYQEALDIAPDNSDVLNDLGTVHMKRDEPDTALRCFDAAIRHRKGFASALYNSGTALQDLGDLLGAKQRFIEALKHKSDLSQAYRCLASIYHVAGDDDNASAVLNSWRKAMPDDPAPGHMLSAGNSKEVPDRASDAYVRDEFDRFADGFDKTLAMLEYQAPQLVTNALSRQTGFRTTGLHVLDAGCGTGLAAPLIKGWCEKLVGVDLSSKMIERANSLSLYDELAVGELVEFMDDHILAYDLIICIDTFVYFGDLDQAIHSAQRSLKAGGWIGFSVEATMEKPKAGYSLNFNGRYKHDEEYLRNVVTSAGLTLTTIDRAVLRQELQQPVHGYLVCAQNT